MPLSSGNGVRALCVTLTMTLLAACGTADSSSGDTSSDNQRGRQGRGGGRGATRSNGGAQNQTAQRTDPYEKVLELKERSGCLKAIAALEPLAEIGRGYEVAQFQLGECYLQTAGAAGSSELIEATRAKGAGWILKAANSQLPSAQEKSARLYLDGIGMAADPVEAGKWLLLLKRNPRRSLVGPIEIDAALEQRLQHDLSEANWATARDRADRWQPVDQPDNQPPARQAPRRAG
jgi:hypothetical protein